MLIKKLQHLLRDSPFTQLVYLRNRFPTQHSVGNIKETITAETGKILILDVSLLEAKSLSINMRNKWTKFCSFCNVLNLISYESLKLV